ncbi:arg-6 protein, partial [Metarhizium brunneum ARSEF 3297]
MNVAENVSPAIKKDYPSFAWTVRQSDENLTCVFEKPDGSFNNNGSVLFYYGCDLRSDALAPVYDESISHGRPVCWWLVVVVGEAPLLKNVMNKHGVELVHSPFIAR